MTDTLIDQLRNLVALRIKARRLSADGPVFRNTACNLPHAALLARLEAAEALATAVETVRKAWSDHAIPSAVVQAALDKRIEDAVRRYREAGGKL